MDCTKQFAAGIASIVVAFVFSATVGAGTALPADLAEQAQAIFGTLPEAAPSDSNPVTDAKVELGHDLFFDPRLSLSHKISCNSCHRLDRFGVDNQKRSPGHRGQRGGRNSPTVLNAALHVSQFWDGRSPDVEDQAKGPVLNPIEMAMPDAAAVERTLRSIPGYQPLFAAAFPDEGQPVTFDNMARAIGAYERRLLTPSPFDEFLRGNPNAIGARAKEGMRAFIEVGCVSCHMGPLVGGGMYQKLGVVKPYPTQDAGRFEVTGQESDRGVFKVPSLRNAVNTWPYFHDGSVLTLGEAITLMARHQLGVELSSSKVAAIQAFIQSLTGKIDPELAAEPELPPSGPNTPPASS